MDKNLQIVANYIRSTTSDGVWPFDVWQAWQAIVRASLQGHVASRTPQDDAGERK